MFAYVVVDGYPYDAEVATAIQGAPAAQSSILPLTTKSKAFRCVDKLTGGWELTAPPDSLFPANALDRLRSTLRKGSRVMYHDHAARQKPFCRSSAPHCTAIRPGF